MNDREELIGFINDLEKEVYACIDSANKGKANEVFSQIKNRMQKEYPYIFFVSKARNDAAQWDRYAQGGQGVAIVFNTETLFKLIFYNQIIMNIMVIVPSNIKRKNCYEIIFNMIRWTIFQI